MQNNVNTKKKMFYQPKLLKLNCLFEKFGEFSNTL